MSTSVPETMTAVRMHEFGGPHVLRPDQVPVPRPGPGEVLVRVDAIGVNPPDWYVREAFPGVPPEVAPLPDLPFIPGSDVSGVVVATSDDAAGVTVGDEVFGMLRFPSMDGHAYAEYVTAPVSDLAPKPSVIDHRHAGAAPMSALTAWQYLIELGHEVISPLQPFLHRPVPLHPGTRVLINGAAGGVGHLALQLAKWKGAHVIAVASGRHEQFVRDLGADEYIDYTRTRPEEVVEDLDLVLDTVGGTAGGRLLRTLKHGGALFPVYPGEYDPDEVAARDITISLTQVRADGVQLAEIGALLRDGELRVAIDSAYPLTDAAVAHERAGAGHIQGKIVLTAH